MNNLEYLNHISQSSQSVARKSSGTKKLGLIIKILLGSIAAIVAIIVIVSIINVSKPNLDKYVQQVYYRTTTLNDTVDDYSRSLKSSDLRAISNSLSGSLIGATSNLDAYYAQNEQKPGDYTEKFLEEESPAFTELDDTLRNAKLNGILDRIYVVQIRLQVSLLLSLIAQTEERAKDPYLIQTLDNYYANLSLVQQKLNAYSSPGD